MKNDGLKKRHDLIQEYHFKLKELNAEKNAITKTINVIKNLIKLNNTGEE